MIPREDVEQLVADALSEAEDKNRKRTQKTVVASLSSAGGLTGVGAWMFLELAMPRVMTEAREQTERMIGARLEQHLAHPHPGAVTQLEWTVVVDRLDELASDESVTGVRDLVLSLDRRVERLEER